MEELAVNLGCTALLMVIYLWCMRKQDRNERTMGAVCFLVTGCFLDRLCILVMEGIIQGNAWGWMRFMGLAISKSMAGVLLLLMCSMSGENAVGRDMKTDKGMSYVEKLTVAGTVFFWCMLIATEIFLDKEIWGGRDFGFKQGDILMVDFVWTLFLFTVLLCFYLSVYWHRKEEHNSQEEQSRQEEIRQTETYLGTIESNYQRTRELWHDLRNHISLLQLLLREEKYDQIRDYLQVFGDEVEQIALPAKSGNLIVDAVFADKIARAKRENIAITIEICDLSKLPLKPDEICSLFGNLLDNAIEECLRVSGERKIIVTCRLRGEDTYFSVRNTLAEDGVIHKNQLVSRKSDRENVVGHGIGLRSVERVVNRYAGEFVTDSEKGMFTAAVWLPGEWQ